MIAQTFLRYEPRFIEDCVFLAVRGHAEERLYHRERDRLYEIVEQEERERAFQNLNTRWFLRLGLADPIETAVSEQPTLLSSLSHCLVARAPGKKEEGAELFVAPKETAGEREKPTACILLRPQTLLDHPRLLTFLRHELLHIADMLDPSFGYEPALPAAEGGPTHDGLLKDRYRVLWDATIDGRMARRGRAPEPTRAERLREFCRLFPMFGEESEQVFRSFFDQESHTHAELVSFASNPRIAMEGRTQPGSRCPLCGFPTHAFEAAPEHLSLQVIAEVTQDFPQWQPSHGLCLQCADLYRARAVSACSTTRPRGATPDRHPALFRLY